MRNKRLERGRQRGRKERKVRWERKRERKMREK